MKKKILVSFCILTAVALVWTFFQLKPENNVAGEYYQALVYMDAQPVGQRANISFLQKDGQLYISTKDAEALFSVQISMKEQNSVKVSSNGGNFLLASEKDTAPVEKEGIKYIPFRRMAEKLNYHVLWENGYLSLISDPLAADFSFSGIRYGNSERLMLEYFGEPDRKDTFANGVARYLYALESSGFFMADVKNGIVSAIYSNSGGWTHKDLPYGMPRGQVEAILQEKYSVDISQLEQNEVGIGNVYFMFDQIGENKLVGVCVGEPLMMDEVNFVSDIPLLEQEMLDILNTERIGRGLSVLSPDESIAACAKSHSIDMGKRNYFDHTNPEGENIGDRMKKSGIAYFVAGENIAAGYRNIIFAHNQLLNSPEHRENLLGDFKYGGIGIAENTNSKYRYYFTQNFYTPQDNH